MSERKKNASTTLMPKVRMAAALTIAVLISVSTATVSFATSAQATWKDVQQAVSAEIRKAWEVFEKGDAATARDILSDAYFEQFEALGMEMVVKKYISSARAYQLERMFGKIRKGMAAGDRERVDRAIATLDEALRQDAAILDEKGIPVEGAGYVTAAKTINEPAPPPVAQKRTQTLATASSSPEDVAKEIARSLDEALGLYRGGDSRGAKAMVSDIYFDLFEGKGLEAMIAMRSGALKTEIESKFGDIMGLMEKSAPDGRVEKAVRELSGRISETASGLSPSKGWVTLFISSFFIIAREGFEAILILSALIAYLRRTGNEDKVRVVGGGVLVAVALSAVTAIIFMKALSTQSSAGRENLEGITMLVASAVLFYVSYWLTSKAEAAKWMSYIQSQVARSIGRGSVLTLGFAAFIVVYREGAETILFYSAMFANSGAGGGVPIWAGFVAGAGALVAVYYAFEYGTARIPIRPFFTVTGFFLFYMAFVFAGEGVVELQIGGLMRSTPLDWAPRIGFLGVHPTLESLLLQGALFVAALAALGYLYIIQPFKARGRVLMDTAHALGDLRRLHDGIEHIRAHVSEGKTAAGSENGRDREVMDHLNEIDEYSHELIGHLKKLEKDLSSILGNVDIGKEKK